MNGGAASSRADGSAVSLIRDEASGNRGIEGGPTFGIEKRPALVEKL